jgi:glycosyltransferase involved in cell wall biosynthesis
MTDRPRHDSRARVLIVAYACSPYRGSESAVGWNRALESAKQFDTWVLIDAEGSVDDIEHYVDEHGPIPGLTFVPVTKTRLLNLAQRVPGLYYPAYNWWHRRAFTVARSLHAQVGFDLVHQATYCGFREPGYAWKLGAPFVWGPVGGTQNFPWRFLTVAGVTGAVAEAIRSVANRVQLRLSPRVRHAAISAAVVLAANSTNQADFARGLGIGTDVMLEMGLSGLERERRRQRSPAGTVRILWSGEIRHFKGLPLLLKALEEVNGRFEFEVRVVGRGPDLARCRRLARAAGIDSRIEWLGWLSHTEALAQYPWADVFVFTSLRDTSGNAALEALAASVPVICLDHQGMHDIVTEDAGIRIPVTTPAEVVTRLRATLEHLAADVEAWYRLSDGARRRASDYLWARQGERMRAVYRKVLQASS